MLIYFNSFMQDKETKHSEFVTEKPSVLTDYLEVVQSTYAHNQADGINSTTCRIICALRHCSTQRNTARVHSILHVTAVGSKTNKK